MCECGNEIVDFGEVCDDGDDLDDNACSLDCTTTCVVVEDAQAVLTCPLIVGSHLVFDVVPPGQSAEFLGPLEVGPEHFYWTGHDFNGNPDFHYLAGCRIPN